MLDIKKLTSKILQRLNAIGTTYTASWTASSTNSIMARVTNNIVLPKGTYICFLKVPVANQSTLYFQIYTGTDRVELAGNVSGSGQSVFSCILELSQDTTVYGVTQMSTSTNYTYIERGYLKAVRIA